MKLPKLKHHHNSSQFQKAYKQTTNYRRLNDSMKAQPPSHWQRMYSLHPKRSVSFELAHSLKKSFEFDFINGWTQIAWLWVHKNVSATIFLLAKKKRMFPKRIIILGRREYIYYIKNPHEKQPVSKPTCSKRTTSEIMSPIGRRSFTTSVLTLKGIFATTWEKKSYSTSLFKIVELHTRTFSSMS